MQDIESLLYYGIAVDMSQTNELDGLEFSQC